MGSKDQALKEYLEDCSRYADLMNGTVFRGKQVVHPEYLEKVTRRKTVFKGIYQEESKQQLRKINNQAETQAKNQVRIQAHYLERERDMVMLHNKRGERFYVACEGQSQPDYDMPARNFIYDGVEYSNQLRCRKKKGGKHRRGRTKPLLPVFHLVLYLGEKRWLSKHTLLEMLDIPESLKEFCALLPDYRIQVVDIHEQNPELFRTEWKDIFALMSHSRNKEKLKIYIEKHNEEIRKLSLETRKFLAVLLDQYELMDDGRMEVKDVCKAWDGAMLLYKEEGRAEGIHAFIELCMEFGFSKQAAQDKMQQKFNLSKKAATEYMKKYYTNNRQTN